MVKKGLSHKLLSSWVGSAAFVFQGKVIGRGESNLDGVDPSEQMATVLVENVVIAPRDLGDLTGKTITINLRSADGIRKGQRVTFFATSWHYGKNIGVMEIGRTHMMADEIRQDAINEVLRQLDEQLEERVKNATIVVSGSVTSTHPSERTEGLPGIEEGVEWNDAKIRVETVEKGRLPHGLRLLFPRGGDREFAAAPKYQPGQEGVWLLHPASDFDEDEKEKKIRPADKQEKEEELMARDPLDYHAISALPRIQALLWRINKQ